MAALMTASMVLIELPLMSSMYGSKKLNMVILAAGAVVLIGSWFAIRQQAAIGDPTVSSIDDPSSRRSDSDVPTGYDSGSGNQETLWRDHVRPAN